MRQRPACAGGRTAIAGAPAASMAVSRLIVSFKTARRRIAKALVRDRRGTRSMVLSSSCSAWRPLQGANCTWCRITLSASRSRGGRADSVRIHPSLVKGNGVFRPMSESSQAKPCLQALAKGPACNPTRLGTQCHTTTHEQLLPCPHRLRHQRCDQYPRMSLSLSSGASMTLPSPHVH